MKCLLKSSQINPYCLARFKFQNNGIRTSLAARHLHTTTQRSATVAPISIPGVPPPPPPEPDAQHVDIRVARRRKQAELLKRGQDMRAVASGQGGGTAKTKRFWKDVHVLEVDDTLQIYLDKRPLRTPSKAILSVPKTKPHLATAIALEWDLLISAQQALKHHLIPLTSLVSRALDIVSEDEKGVTTTRDNIISMVMRYMDTDSLLCWADEPDAEPPGYETHVGRVESLRSIQKREAEKIIRFLTERVWPGVNIVPVLEDGCIMPRSQPEGTKEVIQGWISGLPAFELAGLERAVLASKSLLGAVRLLVEWSPEYKNLRYDSPGGKSAFGVDEAERVASLEVTYQTDMWGMVEDSHDVQKEDLRRQLGSVILLVSAVDS